jgi:hypothetical protein
MGKWRYSSTILDLGIRWDEMSGQVHAPAASRPGKEPPVAIRQEQWALRGEF